MNKVGQSPPAAGPPARDLLADKDFNAAAFAASHATYDVQEREMSQNPGPETRGLAGRPR
jgi:hypothetical protein